MKLLQKIKNFFFPTPTPIQVPSSEKIEMDISDDDIIYVLGLMEADGLVTLDTDENGEMMVTLTEKGKNFKVENL